MAWTSRVGGCQGQWPGTRPKAQKGFEKQVATAWPLWSKKLFIAAMGGKPGWDFVKAEFFTNLTL